MSASKKRKSDAEDDTLVHIKTKADGLAEVVLDSKFYISPERLLEIVMEQIVEQPEASKTMRFVKVVLLSPVSSTYEVFADSFITRASSQAVSTKKSSYTSIGLANLAAMQAFTKKKCLSKDTDDEDWVELGIEPRLENPVYNQQHSLRIGDIGWGFDKNGSISLCGASWDGFHIQHDSVYVIAARTEVVDMS